MVLNSWSLFYEKNMQRIFINFSIRDAIIIESRNRHKFLKTKIMTMMMMNGKIYMKRNKVNIYHHAWSIGGVCVCVY